MLVPVYSSVTPGVVGGLVEDSAENEVAYCILRLPSDEPAVLPCNVTTG